MCDDSPPEAGTAARPRGAMMPVAPLVVTNAICRPSGENCGETFMPGRSTIGRGAPPATGTAKIRAEYGARNPLNGANEYASSRPSGDHEKLSTYCFGGVSTRAVDGESALCTHSLVAGGRAPTRLATPAGGVPSRATKPNDLPSGDHS